jgi:enamine deaminase RidA (YjgF/YER057c/UK114 family)
MHSTMARLAAFPMANQLPSPELSSDATVMIHVPADGAAHTGRLEVRLTERRSFTEYHLTGTVENGATRAAAAADLYLQAAEVLAGRNIQPMQEKIYGLIGARPEVLKLREDAFRRHELDFRLPVTWIQGTPLRGCDFAGLQIWGIAPRDNSTHITTVEGVTGRGRLWTGPGFRILHLPCVRGVKPDGQLAAGSAAQADQMFTNAGLALNEHGMNYQNVIRTWIYVDRLLDWYGDFNRVRTSHYKPAGLGTAGGPAFPASTGIQGRSDGEECLMDVLALESDGPACPVALPIRRSPRQDQSFNYGSAFSRGMAIEMEGRRTVHISGTASINSAGASTHLGDAEMQSLETLMSIAAILQEQGGSLRNIRSATLFCKNRAAWEAWNRVTALLQIPPFPKVSVLADVCRADLLVEMEAVAVI